MKNLEEKPFALIGVNTNSYPAKKLKEVMDKEKLNWRSFVDKEISSKWNLQGTPTLYIIDHKGVIRYKWLGGPGDKVIGAAIDKLVKEAENGDKKK